MYSAKILYTCEGIAQTLEIAAQVTSARNYPTGVKKR